MKQTKNPLLYKTPVKTDKTTKAETAKRALVENIKKDFDERRILRNDQEQQWQLNMEFFNGNQNYNSGGRQFHWQQREVFNHIASMVEARLARITSGTQTPDTDNTSTLCEKILESTFAKLDFDNLASQAAQWSEVCGTVFYKVLWNAEAGRVLGYTENGKPIHQGEIGVVVASPFEIYPDRMTATDMGDVTSLIHAREMTTHSIMEKWGIDVSGDEGKTSALVLERYEVPTAKHPNGRLTIVAGSVLLFDGELPFVNGADGTRTIPFIRQVSENNIGAFFGKSVVTRAIPVQRAYNAVKNRKTEFMNRLACGVLIAEEGSVDLESLEDEGLAPGKVITYKQGTTPPKFLETGVFPAELDREEERLLREFENIVGASAFPRPSDASNASGIALDILAQKDRLRISRTIAEFIGARRNIGAHILRLYKQFAIQPRLEHTMNADGQIEMFTFTSNDIGG